MQAHLLIERPRRRSNPYHLHGRYLPIWKNHRMICYDPPSLRHAPESSCIECKLGLREAVVEIKSITSNGASFTRLCKLKIKEMTAFFLTKVGTCSCTQKRNPCYLAKLLEERSKKHPNSSLTVHIMIIYRKFWQMYASFPCLFRYSPPFCKAA
jgi:hypothetical protein